LVEFGLVERDPQTRRYRLGLAALRLADARGQQVELQGVAPPYVEWLRDRSQETVSLSVGDPEWGALAGPPHHSASGGC
jgi:IclR family transcriptional regulator, acetate operon repressor